VKGHNQASYGIPGTTPCCPLLGDSGGVSLVRPFAFRV